MTKLASLRVDPASSVPLHEQVAAAVRRALTDGEAGPGDRLPPARDIAAVLGVNANTVLRALHTLRDEGLLEFRRGRGVTVSGQAVEHNEVIQKAAELLTVGRRLGYDAAELAAIVTKLGAQPAGRAA